MRSCMGKLIKLRTGWTIPTIRASAIVRQVLRSRFALVSRACACVSADACTLVLIPPACTRGGKKARIKHDERATAAWNSPTSPRASPLSLRWYRKIRLYVPGRACPRQFRDGTFRLCKSKRIIIQADMSVECAVWILRNRANILK